VGFDAAAYAIQRFLVLLVAHFLPFSRGEIATLNAAYRPSKKWLGKPREQLNEKRGPLKRTPFDRLTISFS
jgi:hypothetical protein